MIQENLKLVDAVVELVDARLPLSSRNPEILDITSHKPRLMVLNKCDMADSTATRKWLEYFRKEGAKTLAVSCATGEGIEKIKELATDLLHEKIERDAAKGVKRPVRLMVVGIPNVGKSTFINRISGKAGTKTGDRPGVTRGKQWIRLASGIELLDTPGMLWPKFEDEQVALKLAFTGAIKDEVIDTETLCCKLLEFLSHNYPENLKARYKLDELPQAGFEILEKICQKRGFLAGKGEFDTLRGASVILDEFRGCKLGKITLESV